MVEYFFFDINITGPFLYTDASSSIKKFIFSFKWANPLVQKAFYFNLES